MNKPFYTTADVDSLKPHPLNAEIYGDEPDEELVESMRAHGQLEPIIVAGDDETIISGHRRWKAAQTLGWKEVAVQVRRDLTDLDTILESLIHSNRHRQKTVAQMAREALELTRIMESRQSLGKDAGSGVIYPAFQDRKDGRTREHLAEAVGLSDKSLRKSVEVVKQIDSLRAGGKDREAEDLEKTLNSNISAAHRKATGKQPEPSNRPRSTPPPEDDPAVDTRSPQQAAAEGLRGMAVSCRNFRKQIAEYGEEIGRHPRYQFIMDALDNAQIDMVLWSKKLNK
tara:strand:- start:1534 stop:2385 length:852 start_codon:yes stop_codon:yes gene_type:complete